MARVAAAALRVRLPVPEDAAETSAAAPSRREAEPVVGTCVVPDAERVRAADVGVSVQAPVAASVREAVPEAATAPDAAVPVAASAREAVAVIRALVEPDAERVRELVAVNGEDTAPVAESVSEPVAEAEVVTAPDAPRVRDPAAVVGARAVALPVRVRTAVLDEVGTVNVPVAARVIAAVAVAAADKVALVATRTREADPDATALLVPEAPKTNEPEPPATAFVLAVLLKVKLAVALA